MAEVRVAAIEAFVPSGRSDALELGYAALFDRDAAVRVAAAETVGRRGAEVVPHLRELALARSGRDANGPLGALAFAGAEGQGALLELSQTHPDAGRRAARPACCSGSIRASPDPRYSAVRSHTT